MSLLQGCVVECVLNLPVFSMFEIATVLFITLDTDSGGLCCIQLGAHRISHLEKADAALFFGARAAFPRCHCFRFHLGEASRPHISSFFFFFGGFVCFAVNPLRCVCVVFGLFEVWGELKPFLDHGGHRGSRLDSAAPDCPALCSSEQRVRHIKERHAAYCWSGKKWPEGSPLEQMRPLLYDCFAWCLLKSKARFCVLETQSFLVVMTVCSFSAHLWD